MSKTKQEKRFSKEKWLAAANEQMDKGYLSQKEIDDALVIWVNSIDGKTKTECEELGCNHLSEKWFV